jgi:hypothetical protein
MKDCNCEFKELCRARTESEHHIPKFMSRLLHFACNPDECNLYKRTKEVLEGLSFEPKKIPKKYEKLEKKERNTKHERKETKKQEKKEHKRGK